MDIVCCQLDTVWEDKAANFGSAKGLLDTVRIPEDALIVFPEMFATGFSMNVEAVAEKPDGPTHDFLAEVAGRYRAYALGGVVTRGAGGKGRNQAVCYDAGGWKVVRYTKLHPFTPAGEGEHYETGGEVATFCLAGAVVAPLICYDLRFPEVFRQAARRGAEVLAVLANWPSERAEHWAALLKARAIENQAVVIGANRCGADPNCAYPGRSMVVGPRGDVLAEAGDGPCVLQTSADLDDLRAYRREFPALADMRPDLQPPGGGD